MTDDRIMTDDRSDWLEWRRGGIGGSDVAAVLGISPFASPWSTWADKLGLLPPEPESEQMAAGRWLEAAIGPWFTHETGLDVAGEQTWCTHREHDHHRATVDGFVVDGCATPAGFDDEGGLPALGLLEIKVTGPGRRWDHLPEDKQAQGQWQMHVTGLDRVWFAVLMGRRLDIHELKRDQADIDFMVDRVDAFWSDHVQAQEPPPVDGSDATTRALAAVFDGALPGFLVATDADEEMAATVAAWRQAKADKKAAEAAETEHGNRIRQALGDTTELVRDGELLASWRQQASRRLDQQALKAEHPAIVRQFTTESTTRVLRNHARKEKTT